jgi:glucosamine-6-phosphate deaminase
VSDLVEIVPDALRAGEVAAARIGALVADAARRRARTVIGCPAGRTPRTTYAALARLAREDALDLSRLEVVMMDEYVVEAAGGFAYCPPDAPYSCRRFAERELRAVLNAGLPPERQLPAAQIHFPSPQAPEAYEDAIATLGGVDLFLLAAGASDGHVAFNPPGSALDSPTRILALAESTRSDNLATFPTFRGLDEVPRFGLTVGLGTIRTHSRAVLLLLLGEQKRYALARTRALAEFDPAWPASVVRACKDARIVADAAAAGCFSR